MESVWVFNGALSQFPSGVFSSKDAAEAWIRTHTLSGTLTQYPVDMGMYDYATSRGQFVPSKPEHKTAAFVGKFSGGGIDHFHYEDGKRG
jgi:hypothetical protein